MLSPLHTTPPTALDLLPLDGCTSCVVMYLGPLRTVRGDKKLDANCCLYVGVQLLIPLTVGRVNITVPGAGHPSESSYKKRRGLPTAALVYPHDTASHH
jgi:hypothetical protein